MRSGVVTRTPGVDRSARAAASVAPAGGALRRAIVAPVVAGMAVLAGSIAATPTVCPFRICTDHACPGCGLTRGVAAAARGDLSLSVRYHPLAMALAVQLVIGWIAFVRAEPQQWPRVLRRVVPLVWINIAALVVVWAVRWRLGLLDFVL